MLTDPSPRPASCPSPSFLGRRRVQMHRGVHNNPALGGCLPTAWQGRSFSMMTEGDQTVAVGAGGTETLKTRAGPLLNTKIVNWCGLPDNGDPPPDPCIEDPTLPTCQDVNGNRAAGQ